MQSKWKYKIGAIAIMAMLAQYGFTQQNSKTSYFMQTKRLNAIQLEFG